MQSIDREKLRALLRERGMSSRAASLAAGLGETAVKDILSSKSRDPGTATVSAIASVLDVTFESLFSDSPPGVAESSAPFSYSARLRPVARRIPILGDVAAGLWKEAIPLDISDAGDFLPLDVLGYERAQLYALRVVGPSMNLVYPPGRYVVIAPAAEAGVRWGDHVIVERQQGALSEITIKELVNENGRAALWPRSTDIGYQTPLYLHAREEDQSAPKIIGVVVADYARRERPDVMFEPIPIK